jgi:hypothetical protein
VVIINLILIVTIVDFTDLFVIRVLSYGYTYPSLYITASNVYDISEFKATKTSCINRCSHLSEPVEDTMRMKLLSQEVRSRKHQEVLTIPEDFLCTSEDGQKMTLLIILHDELHKFV